MSLPVPLSVPAVPLPGLIQCHCQFVSASATSVLDERDASAAQQGFEGQLRQANVDGTGMSHSGRQGLHGSDCQRYRDTDTDSGTSSGHHHRHGEHRCQ